MKDIRVVRRSWSETGAHAKLDTCYFFWGVCGMVSIIAYGMVWYVRKHKQKDNVGTFGIVLDRLETFWNHLNAFRAFWDFMGAFGRRASLGRLAQAV